MVLLVGYEPDTNIYEATIATNDQIANYAINQSITDIAHYYDYSDLLMTAIKYDDYYEYFPEKNDCYYLPRDTTKKQYYKFVKRKPKLYRIRSPTFNRNK